MTTEAEAHCKELVQVIVIDDNRNAYVQAWLGFLQPLLEASAPQAAQKNINLEILRNLPIAIPPIEHQRRFQNQCDAVIALQMQQALTATTADAILSSLLSRTFETSSRKRLINGAGC
jgi:hypothetical protein